MAFVRRFGPSFVLALCAAGCSKEAVNPLDCAFDSYLDNVSIAVDPAQVDFHADWGTAPSKMKLRLFRTDGTRVGVRGCGRDDDGREWELQAGWSRLPVGATEVEAVFYDKARLDAGERLGADEPTFGGSLLRCDPVGCVAVDRAAFTYAYTVNFSLNVSGSASLRDLDFDAGRLSASIFADPGEPIDEPATRVEFALAYDPQALAALWNTEGGAGGESGLGADSGGGNAEPEGGRAGAGPRP
jgi:hypothetical protein